MLQYALTELFERRDSRTLTRESYQAIGGTVGALARRAEELYADYETAGQEAIRQLFLRLVTLGEGTEDTRRRVARSELLAIAHDVDVMEDIINAFADYRLLAMDHDPATRSPTVEVAHEAILREWERLRMWLNESRDDIKLQRQLAVLTADWHTHERDASYLVRGSRLLQFQAWASDTELSMTPLERDYLEASIAAETQRKADEQAQIERETRLRQQRLRILQGLVGVFLVAAVIAGGLALEANYQRNKAEDARTEAVSAEQEAERERDTETSRRLAASAEDELTGTNAERGVLLALEALENYPFTAQAQSALVRAVEVYRPVRTFDTSGGDYGFQEDIWIATWSPDGERIAGGGRSGPTNDVIIWDYATGEVLLAVNNHSELCEGVKTVPMVGEIAWSPSGDRIATGAFEPMISRENSCGIAIWDSLTGEVIATVSGFEEPFWSSELVARW